MLDDRADLVRTAFGHAPRCQAKCKATRDRCGRPARRGFAVCSVHGAGTRRRELAGVRTNPRAGSLVHGGRAQHATLVALGEVDAAFAAARAEVAGRPARLRDLDEVLADLWALRRLLVQQVQVGLGDRQPAAVLQVLDSLAATIERAARIEQRLSHPEHIPLHLVDALVKNTINVITQYVQPGDVPAALDKLAALQARCVPGSVAEAHLPPEVPSDRPPDEHPIERLAGEAGPGGKADAIALYRPPFDERSAGSPNKPAMLLHPPAWSIRSSTRRPRPSTRW